MRKILNTRKKVIIAGAAAGAIVLGTGGAAFAYFTSTGTGSGTAAVGTASWNVSAPTTTGGPLYPNSGTVTLTFNVTNNSGGNEQLTSATTAVVKHDASNNAMNGSNTFSGCNYQWFNAPVSLPASPIVSAGQTVPVTVQVSLPDNGNDQTACAGHSPEIDLTVG